MEFEEALPSTSSSADMSPTNCLNVEGQEPDSLEVYQPETFRITTNENQESFTKKIKEFNTLEMEEFNFRKGDTGLTFSQLPIEVKLKIFSYFTSSEMILKVPNVCSEWGDLAKVPSLWKTITLFFMEVQTKKVLEVLANSNSLTELFLLQRDDVKEILLAVAKHCPNLKALTVHAAGLINNGILKILAEGCPHIQSLCMTYACFKGEHFMTQFSWFPNLNKVAFAFGENAHPYPNLPVCQFQKLTSLHLKRVKCGEDVPIILKMLKRHLRKFSLVGIYFTLQPHLLYPALAACKNLEKLDLRISLKMDNGRLLSALGQLKQLYALRLKAEGDIFQCEGIAKPSFFNLSHIRQLDFGGNELLCNEVLIAVGDQCSLLTHLNLTDCKCITDESLLHVIKKCPHLRELNVHGASKLTADAVQRMCASRSNLTQTFWALQIASED